MKSDLQPFLATSNEETGETFQDKTASDAAGPRAKVTTQRAPQYAHASLLQGSESTGSCNPIRSERQYQAVTIQ